jgi:hypothetical protein
MADAARQRALDFVDAAERLSSSGVVRLFESEIDAREFHAYIMAGLPAPEAAHSDFTLANGSPVKWFELYTRGNFSTLDPAPRHSAATAQRFEWSEARYDRDDAGVGARLARPSRHRVACDPIFGPGSLTRHRYVRDHEATLGDDVRQRSP